MLNYSRKISEQWCWMVLLIIPATKLGVSGRSIMTMNLNLFDLQSVSYIDWLHIRKIYKRDAGFYEDYC